MLALTGDRYGPSLLVLALPGLATLVLLVRLQRTVPNPAAYEPASDGAGAKPVPFSQVGRVSALPRRFWVYAAFTAATMSGFATFGVISFHLVHRHVLGAAAVPLVYAGTMAAGGLASLATGWWYDRSGPAVLTVLPVLAALVPVLAFTRQPAFAVLGALLWGAATGVQESTLRATVADLVPSGRRATAYGVFAAVVGGGAFVGGALTGALYTVSVPALLVTVAVIQAGALVLLAATRRRGADG
jgi:predicted MFS family arabinose efflux permease